jgi:hypothetical protein
MDTQEKTKPMSEPEQDEDMLREYSLDYGKARPNRFAGRIDKGQVVVLLDPDVSEVFTTPESVNAVLRALIETMPKTRSRSGRKSSSRSTGRSATGTDG